MVNDNFLEQKLQQRRAEGSFRSLRSGASGVDFSSNDYLGIVRNHLLNLPSQNNGDLAMAANAADTRSFADITIPTHGSTGSRLLTGNSLLTERVEKEIAEFHEGEAALIFNSGYDANIGLLSSIAVKGDTIIYDFLSHASIRDGIRISAAQSFSFLHNDVEDLERRLKTGTGNIFVVTESVFSMDGDCSPLAAISILCDQYNAFLIVDEAHATGVIGEKGEGLTQALQLHKKCFARVYTFGKALGCHGAVVVGSDRLRDYLINFSRAFIYTTALPHSAVFAIRESYQLFPRMNDERVKLKELISMFQTTVLSHTKLISTTPIQGVVVPGNDATKVLSSKLADIGLDVRPILYPTVPRGSERLRIILHSFNSQHEVQKLMDALA